MTYIVIKVYTFIWLTDLYTSKAERKKKVNQQKYKEYNEKKCLKIKIFKNIHHQ